MNIVEAIANASTSPVELTDKYIARLYIEGKAIYEKPVDFRIKAITLPLNPSNINFIYDKTSKETYVHKHDYVCMYYYPIGSHITLNDGLELIVISYGTPSIYNNQFHVDLNCKLVQDEYSLIETIDNKKIKDRILFELNRIVESNEIIKNLLPSYSYNWLTFSDDDLNAIKKFNASKLLRLIDKLADDERYFYMDNISGIIDAEYEALPSTFMTYANIISKIDIKDKVQCGFSGVHSFYNPRYVYEWLVYILENDIIKDETELDEFYLVNKAGLKTNLILSKDNNNYKIDFITPDECNKTFSLYAKNVRTYGSYIEYNIEDLSLTGTNKTTKEVIDYNLTDKSNLLDTATQIISILSGSNIPNGISLKEYYDNIDTYLNNIVPDFDLPIKDDTNISNESIWEDDEEADI